VNPEFVAYLASVGIVDALRQRVESIYDFYRQICPEEVSGLFVTEYIKEDGTREYESLWFFSAGFVMEAKGFVTNDDFDMASLRGRVVHWQIQKSEYDFRNATERSRLHLEFALGDGVGGTLRSSKENCDRLRDVLRRYIVANMSD
jgi:hypothetical protein